MRQVARSALLLATAMMLAAPAHAESEEQAGDKTMGERWDETVETLGHYTAEQRDKALEAGRNTLAAMDRRIERMEAWTKKHWASLSEEAREKRTAMLESLRKQRNDAAEWYGGMKHSSAETWDSVKSGFISSYNKLQDAYDESVDSFTSDDDGETGGENTGSAD